MSMLSRFRKPGGFQQLLVLIETCDSAKQKSLLHLVSQEDPGWAHLLKLKTLSFEKILGWPSEILMEITPTLSDQVLAIAYQMAVQLSENGKQPYHEKWLRGIPSIKAREIQDIAKSKSFTQSEQNVASIKVIQTVRELESKGQLRFAAFAPLLEIDKRLAA